MARRDSSRATDHLVSAAYVLAALLVVFPGVDYLANTWALRLGDLQWRYGTEGLLAGFLLTPFLGVGLACGLAAWRGHTRLLTTLGLLMLVAAVLLVLVCGDFALNALQLRHSAPPDALARFEVGTAKTVLEYALVVAAFLFSGVAALRAGRQIRSDERSPGPPQVVVPRPR